MAEGLLEGVLGSEEEKIDPTVSGAEPIVAAVAANLASLNSEVAADGREMFREQTLLLKLQRRNAETEYEFFESEAGPHLLADQPRLISCQRLAKSPMAAAVQTTESTE